MNFPDPQSKALVHAQNDLATARGVGHITIERITEVQARLEREAYRDFGSGHPAKRNFGDCFALPAKPSVWTAPLE